MEDSPLRYLDYHVSLMLANQVKVSQEDEARRFHLNIFTAPYELPFNMRVLKVTIHRVLTRISKYWGDFWDEELSGKTRLYCVKYKHTLEKRIILYEQELKELRTRCFGQCAHTVQQAVQLTSLITNII